MLRTMSLESIRAEQTPATMTYLLSCLEHNFFAKEKKKRKESKIVNYTKQKSFLRGTNRNRNFYLFVTKPTIDQLTLLFLFYLGVLTIPLILSFMLPLPSEVSGPRHPN